MSRAMRTRLSSDPAGWTAAVTALLRTGLAAAAGLRRRIAGWVRRAGYRPERRYMRGAARGGESGPGSATGRG